MKMSEGSVSVLPLSHLPQATLSTLNACFGETQTERKRIKQKEKTNWTRKESREVEDEIRATNAHNGNFVLSPTRPKHVRACVPVSAPRELLSDWEPVFRKVAAARRGGMRGEEERNTEKKAAMVVVKQRKALTMTTFSNSLPYPPPSILLSCRRAFCSARVSDTATIHAQTLRSRAIPPPKNPPQLRRDGRPCACTTDPGGGRASSPCHGWSRTASSGCQVRQRRRSGAQTHGQTCGHA